MFGAHRAPNILIITHQLHFIQYNLFTNPAVCFDTHRQWIFKLIHASIKTAENLKIFSELLR